MCVYIYCFDVTYQMPVEPVDTVTMQLHVWALLHSMLHMQRNHRASCSFTRCVNS